MLFILLINLLQLQPVGAPSGMGLCILLTHSHLFVLLALALASGISPRNPGSFCSRMVFRDHQFLTPSLVKQGCGEANREINCPGCDAEEVAGRDENLALPPCSIVFTPSRLLSCAFPATRVLLGGRKSISCAL